MASATQLTANDAAILGALFDAEASLTGHALISSAGGTGIYDSKTTAQVQRLEREILLDMNSENPPLPSIQAAIINLGKLIEVYPDYASAYNNRAQARRMLTEIDHTLEDANTMPLIFSDLARAIALASPPNPTATVSPEQAKVLASAHTHRAYLLYRASRSEDFGKAVRRVEAMSTRDKDGLEEMASRDFSAGGRYGNRIAKQLAVQTNPYAKLCGSIVKEALRKEMEDYFSGPGQAV
ncbi:hypothetical protein OHC33_011185 [Knufia fluminis]|uniref:Uncharacterized protein n=1 Tax=Knufia fluminis TaxID=191047 RepID=A0AAN8EEK1_9EURO|nr:hypothetical protein OHC33_011185 [Knufia fluminis]